MPTDPPASTPIPEPLSEPWTSPFEDLLKETDTPDGLLGVANIQRPDPTIGSPRQDSLMFPGQQSYPDTCAIRCQEYILTQFWGYPIDEGALVHEAMEQGWYAPGGGTPPQDVGNLLELHGVPINRYCDATIFHLANELAQGHKVIIGVDSGELWNQNPLLEKLEDHFGIQGADHAVVVSGIDTSNPNDVHVIISDPGTGEAVASYPMAQFLDAWADSQFFMVTTQQPPPPYLHLPEMVNFDYGLGHLPTVAGMPYQEFLTLEDQPQQWDSLTHSPSLAAEPDLGGGAEEFTAEPGPENPPFEPEPLAGWEAHSESEDDPGPDGDLDPDGDDIVNPA